MPVSRLFNRPLSPPTSKPSATRPGFEPGQREPKSLVLPLHYRVIAAAPAASCLSLLAREAGPSMARQRSPIALAADRVAQTLRHSGRAAALGQVPFARWSVPPATPVR